MQRLTRLEDICFPVELHPVYAHVKKSGREIQTRIPNKQAVVNMKRQAVVGVVASGYQLVTNSDALQAAHDCASVVFPETNPHEWQVAAVDAPTTGSYCHIDIAHSTTALNFEYLYSGTRPEVPDVFGPFIRVSNSYNARRALAFSIGFYRKVCANGMVGPQNVIRFRFNHTRSAIALGIRFEIERERIESMKNSFIESFRALHEYRVNRARFAPLVRTALRIRNPNWPNNRDAGRPTASERYAWTDLLEHISSLADKYSDELGENAYAVLNAITDLASNRPNNRYLRRDKHSLQKLAGEWLLEFRARCQDAEFCLDEYLAHNTEGDASRMHR